MVAPPSSRLGADVSALTRENQQMRQALDGQPVTRVPAPPPALGLCAGLSLTMLRPAVATACSAQRIDAQPHSLGAVPAAGVLASGLRLLLEPNLLQQHPMV